MPFLFGREEGAALVAVERANGGELAPLQQVLWALNAFTLPGARPTPAGFAASATLLIRLGAVEYTDDQLGLTPEGRKLLRRSGMPNDPRHVALVTGLLEEFVEQDLEPEGTAVAPTEADVRLALSDGERIQETAGGIGTPIIGAEVPISTSFLGLGTAGLVTGSHWVPAVLPVEPDLTEDPRLAGDTRPVEDQSTPEERPEFLEDADVPPHPIIDRFRRFGQRRRGRTEPEREGR